MINNIWGLVLGNSLPIFNVILVINFFRGLPKEIEEAALIDGAGPWSDFLEYLSASLQAGDRDDCTFQHGLPLE